jgi:hypothetical protein
MVVLNALRGFVESGTLGRLWDEAAVGLLSDDNVGLLSVVESIIDAEFRHSKLLSSTEMES